MYLDDRGGDKTEYIKILALVSSLGFLVAIYFAYNLTRETRGDKYWVFFLVAVIALGVHHMVEVPWAFGYVEQDVKFFVQEVGEIISGVSIAYASYGIYMSMKKIREKVAE